VRRENPFPDRHQRKKGVENNDSAPALGSVLVCENGEMCSCQLHFLCVAERVRFSARAAWCLWRQAQKEEISLVRDESPAGRSIKFRKRDCDFLTHANEKCANKFALTFALRLRGASLFLFIRKRRVFAAEPETYTKFPACNKSDAFCIILADVAGISFALAEGNK